MRFLKTALLETLMLALAAVIVAIGAKIIDYNCRYDDYAASGSEITVTIGSALGYVEDGETLVKSDVYDYYRIPDIVPMPQFVLNIFNTKISFTTAKYTYLLPLMCIIAGYLCLMLGIGWPLSWYKHSVLGIEDKIWNHFVDKSRIYIDGRGRFDRYVGEYRSTFFTVLLWAAGLIGTFIWGHFIILIIVFNVILAVISTLVTIIAVELSMFFHTKKYKKKSSQKWEHAITTFGKYFRVVSMNDTAKSLYLNKYWNAVVVERILECDGKGARFESQDATDTIVYGNENKHQRYELYRLLHYFVLNSTKKKMYKELKDALKAGRYHWKTNVCQDESKEYLFNLEGTEIVISLCNPDNLSLLHTILMIDRDNKIFVGNDWKVWATTSVEDRGHQLMTIYKQE